MFRLCHISNVCIIDAKVKRRSDLIVVRFTLYRMAVKKAYAAQIIYESGLSGPDLFYLRIGFIHHRHFVIGQSNQFPGKAPRH